MNDELQEQGARKRGGSKAGILNSRASRVGRTDPPSRVIPTHMEARVSREAYDATMGIVIVAAAGTVLLLLAVLYEYLLRG